MSSGWKLVPNPEWKGKKPKKAKILCHDHTPFLTIKCSCGYMMHIHKSQVEAMPYPVAFSICHNCGKPLFFEKKWLLETIEKAWKGIEIEA